MNTAHPVSLRRWGELGLVAVAGVTVFLILLDQFWHFQTLGQSLIREGISNFFSGAGGPGPFLQVAQQGIRGAFLVSLLFANAALIGHLVLRLPVFRAAHVPFLAWPLGFLVYGLTVFLFGSSFGLAIPSFYVLQLLPLFLRLLLLKRWPLRLAEGFPMSRIKSHAPGLALLALCSLPVLMLSQVPPIDYDVLEYHLGAPREYWLNGGITFLSHNIYANMPSLASMLNLVLVGFDAGDAAKLMQTGFLLLTALALASMIPGFKAWVVAGCYVLLPEWILSSATARTEPMIAFYAFWVFRALFAAKDRSLVFAAGLFCGALFCLKYSAVLLVLPVALALLVWRREWRHAPWLLAGSALPALPWALRNGLVAGNPLYPFFQGMFGWLSGTAAENLSHFTTRHFADGFGPAEYFQAFLALWADTGAARLGFIGIFCCLVFFRGRGSLEKILLLITGITWLIWFHATHRVPRFFFLTLPLQSLLVLHLWTFGAVWLRRVFTVAVFFQILYGWVFFGYYLTATPLIHYFNGHWSRDRFISHFDPTYPLGRVLRLAGLEAPHVLYIAEARHYYRDWPVTYSTPYLPPVFIRFFGADGLDKPALRETGINAIYINTSELKRVRPKFPETVPLSDEQILAILDRDAVLVMTHPRNLDRLYLVP